MARHSLDVVEVDKDEGTNHDGVNGNHSTFVIVKHIREEEYGVSSFYFTNILVQIPCVELQRNLRFAIVRWRISSYTREMQEYNSMV